MTKSKKDELMKLILPAIIRRTENSNPRDAVWYATMIINELEERGYFEINYSTPLEYPII